MKTDSLRHKALKAVIWNACQKYGSLIIAFGANIILARELSAEDYGLIGLLTVFIAIANSITESGFSSALIQKKDITQTEYCTVFLWNIGVAVILYTLIFVFAPQLGKYFDNPLLSPILRIQGIVIIINALCTIQTTRLTKQLDFKALAIRNLIATSVGSAIGISLVLLDYGVWGLVWQAIANSIVGCLLLWYVSKWRPQWIFSCSAFKGMFKFGSYIFLSGICNTIYLNIQSFIIGKVFSVKDLGYYSQAKRLEQVPVEGTSAVLSQVLFPIYSSIADNRQRHIEAVRKNIKIITYITFPIMVLLIVIAHPLIVGLFTDKWEPSVPMLQILCIVGMFSPVNVANTEIFRAIGAGLLYFNLQTIKRVVGLIFILASVPFGLYPMLWTIAGMSIITYMMNLYCTNRYFGYSYSKQLKDIIPNFLLSVSVGVLVALILHYLNLDSDIIKIICGIAMYLGLYAGISAAFNMAAPKLILSFRKH
ncbi:MAG: lipopolysaccharide biosynthesis protein [Bacteroides sp.]|nr:lipopolysaccharide biosynthesis protein [Bacteroides sp.]